MEEKETNHEKEVGIMTTATTVQKWGNSLAVRIPKEIAKQMEIHQGTEMEMSVVEGKGMLTLMPKKHEKKYLLDELLAQCKPENRHQELDLGIEGNELI